MASNRRLISCLIVSHIALLQYCCSAELLVVAAVTRHGARNVLSKNYNLSESAGFGGPSLLLQGKRQCWTAGVAFRARYIDPATCGGAAGGGCLAPDNATAYGRFQEPGVGFTAYNTLVRSSALDRTLLSGQAFMAGVFPDVAAAANQTAMGQQQLLPIYSMEESQDHLVRGYTRCPQYVTALRSWFASSTFTAKEAESQQLREQIAGMAPTLNTSLANWWNVYDSFNVWRTYGAGDPTPEIDDATYQQVKELAYWLELNKASSALSSNLLGGALLADLMQRLSDALEAHERGSPAAQKLLVVSAHYNTQLGLLAALSLDRHPPAAAALPWLRPDNGSIPATAAVLALEVHKAGSAAGELDASTGRPVLAVRLVAQDGPSAARYVVVPLPCAAAGDAAERLVGPGACTWGAFVRAAAPAGLRTVGDWCEACRNTETYACQARQAALLGGGAPSAPAPASSGDCGDVWKVATAVVVSVASTAALGGALAWWLLRRQQRRLATQHAVGAIF